VRAVKGSTRLEAKRQRRRESRDTGRRRPPIISESEFLARREAVERVMVVRQQGDRTQIAVLEDGVLVEHYVDKASHQSYVGNVYLGKVQNVLPSMEAAFVDIGKGRNAVLYAGEVNFDATGLEGVAKRIESALKSGQSIMVQVTKDPIGHKGARLTSQISLPGRYLVYVPGASMTGISRKLPDTERARLKQILKKVAPEEGGIIVRTAAEGASEEELQHDVTRLVAQWQAIERKAKTANAPDLLYGEPDLTIRVVRDIFNEDFTKLVISSDSEWDLVDEYVRYVAPNLADRLERWSDEAEDDLFSAYRIDEQLAKALDRKVWLPSGGSLVIDTTEAMTVIDVNTGKFTGQGGNLEQTVTRNNLEAAEEIVRQLRLRDVGGIIVIDFIDMVLESNRDLVLRRLIECLARDRTKHQVAEVTSLGLVQMTRKRVGSGLLAAFSVPCEHCNGRGVLISTDLTEVHSHGRNGQLAPMPKPGPGRSRSARSKAIAEVAAKTIEPLQPAAADGQVQEPATAEPATGEPAVAEVAAAEPKAGRAKAAESKTTEPKAARSSSTRSRRSEAAASRERAEAESASAVATVEQAGAQAQDGESDSAAAPRRRVRRSAYREAGPPDSALADGSVPSPDAADAGAANAEGANAGGANAGGAEAGGAEAGGAEAGGAEAGGAEAGGAEAGGAEAGGADTGDGQRPAAVAGSLPAAEHNAEPAIEADSQPVEERESDEAPAATSDVPEMQPAHTVEG
jgi:ribonuclease E